VAREITIAETSTSLGVIQFRNQWTKAGAQKQYGREYDAPTPENPVYHPQP